MQECGIGLVRIRCDGDRLAFAAPPAQREGPLAEEDIARIVRGLGIARSAIKAHAWCDNGPPWRAVMMSSADEVLALEPDPAVLGDWFVGVVAPHPADEASPAYEVRAFFPGAQGMIEDPVTGSLNAAVGQWLTGAGPDAPRHYVARQGTALGRAGRVHVVRDDNGDVWIGGGSVTCIDGQVEL